MFDKVVQDLSGKVLSFFKMLTSQKFPTPGPDTKPLSGRAPFRFSLVSFCFFCWLCPNRVFVWPHPAPPPPPDSIQLWFKHSCWTGAASRDPKATVVYSVWDIYSDWQLYSQGNKSLLEVVLFKPRTLCLVYTRIMFHAVYRLSCFLRNLESWTNIIFRHRSMTMTLKSSETPCASLASIM